MEMSSGKILDEVCNYFNEIYRDEVLYTAWADGSRFDSRATVALPAKTGIAGFTSRLYTRKE